MSPSGWTNSEVASKPSGSNTRPFVPKVASGVPSEFNRPIANAPEDAQLPESTILPSGCTATSTGSELNHCVQSGPMTVPIPPDPNEPSTWPFGRNRTTLIPCAPVT